MEYNNFVGILLNKKANVTSKRLDCGQKNALLCSSSVQRSFHNDKT